MDNRVRVVDIRTEKGQGTRTLVKLVLLPTNVEILGPDNSTSNPSKNKQYYMANVGAVVEHSPIKSESVGSILVLRRLIRRCGDLRKSYHFNVFLYNKIFNLGKQSLL